MKKFLLSVAALAMSFAASAQVDVQHQKVGVVEQSPYFAQQSAVVHKAAKRIAANQRWVGYYSSDALAAAHKGMGIYNFPGDNKVAICLSEAILKPYVGKNIVGLRFGLCEEIGSSSISLYKSASSKPGDVCRSANVEKCVIGWNEVKFSEPYPIKAGEELYAGYTYTQLADNTDTKSYPFSAVKDGLAEQPLWVYCKLGNDTGWYNFSMDGYNISIQVLVEGDFAEYDVMPSDFGTVKGAINSNVETSVEFTNNAVEAVSSLDYIVSVDGVAGSEQHVAISPSVGYNKTGTFKVSIPCGSTEGLKNVKVEVTKVNGHKNGGATIVAEGKLSVAANMYKRNLCIEEFTTEQCGNCPRVAGYLHEYLKTADPNRVFAVCHHAGYYTDWLTKSCDKTLLYLYNDGGRTFGTTYYHQHVIRDFNSAWGTPVTWEGNKFSATYEFDVDSAWKKDDLKVVAFLNKHSTKSRIDNRIENVAGKNLIQNSTSIESVGSAYNVVEVARYNAAGQRISGKQKGLNIVKLSNGKTLKIMVK